MKNKEFYNDKLVAIAISGNNVAKVANRLTTCEDCDWYYDAELVCSELRSIWADKEYTEDVFGIEPCDMFYFVDCDGCVQSGVYIGEPQMIEFGNACKDESYMKKRAKEIHLYNLLSNFAYQVNEGWEPDWENPLERKYYIFYDYEEHKCRIYLNNSWQFLNVIYFKSKELAQRAVDEVVVPFEKGEL